MADQLDLGNLIAHLRLDDSQWRKAVSGVATSLNRAAASIGAAGRKMSMYVTAPIVGAFTYATKQMMAQEKASKALSAALAQSGIVSESVTDSFERFASQQQRLTKYSDDLILSTMAQGKNLGVQAGQLETVTRAAMGLAAQYGKELPEAMMLLGRASQGSTAMLARLGIVLDENLTAEQKYQELIKRGLAAYPMAIAEVQTMSGALAQLRNSISDAGESLGIELYPYIFKARDAIRTFLDWWERVPQATKANIVQWGLVAAAIGPALLALQGVIWAVGLVGTVFAALTSPIIAAAGLAYVFAAQWDIHLNDVKIYIKALGTAFQELYNWLGSKTSAFLAWFVDSWKRAREAVEKGSSTWYQSMGAGMERMAVDFVSTISGATAWALSGGKLSFAEAFVQTEEEVKSLAGRTADAIKGTFALVPIYTEAVAIGVGEKVGGYWEKTLERMNADYEKFVSAIKAKMASMQLTPFGAAMETANKWIGEMPWSQFESFQAAASKAMPKGAVAELEQMQEAVFALKEEHRTLGMISEERERSLTTARFQMQVQKALVNATEDERKKITELAAEHKKYLDLIEQGRRGPLAMTVQIREWAQEASNAYEQLGQVITKALDSATDAIQQFVTTGKMGIKELAAAILNDLLRVIIQTQITVPLWTQMLQPAMGAMFPSLFGAAAGGAAAGAGATTGGAGVAKFGIGGARGLVFGQGQLIPLAAGGVIASASLLPYAYRKTALIGEAGPEAVMPLARDSGGRLGVRAEQPRVSVENRLKVVNVYDREEMLAAMRSDSGEKVVMNILRRKGVI
jgi:lambda family phage tail tape measure protein